VSGRTVGPLVAAGLVGLLAAGCGVPLQDEPEPLVAPSASPVPTPTVTNRPDPTPTSSRTVPAAPTVGPPPPVP
jgi:hypothetical protein